MSCRVLVLCAHPDDAEVFAGGLLVRHSRLGATIRIVSVTDGSAGHQSMSPEELKSIRRKEAAEAGATIGAEYVTLDFVDGRLQPSLEVRECIIREIRQFAPDLVLTHRTNDYHPDHRAVGIAVQDASYMVTVPNICPDVKPLRDDPIVASMCDMFTRPNRMRADVILNVQDEYLDSVAMAACHRSQFFDWLAYHDGVLEEVPDDEAGRLDWLAGWLGKFHHQRREFFSSELREQGMDPTDESIEIEVFEVSEYAAALSDELRGRLFPN
ncbi:MAG: PIG-L family deacetylase [Planctomycetota bacterium]